MVSAPRRLHPSPSSSSIFHYLRIWFQACLPPSAATIRRKPVNLPSIPRIGPTPLLVRRWLAATFPLLGHLYPAILVGELIGRSRRQMGPCSPACPFDPCPCLANATSPPHRPSNQRLRHPSSGSDAMSTTPGHPAWRKWAWQATVRHDLPPPTAQDHQEEALISWFVQSSL